MQVHSPETASSVSSIFRSEPVLQSMLCFCWTSGIAYLLGAERLQPELLSELLSGPCDSSGLLGWGFLGSFLAHLLTSSCGFRFRDPARRGICPVLLKLKLIQNLFSLCLLTNSALFMSQSWSLHAYLWTVFPTHHYSSLLIITHYYSSRSVCSLLYASLLDFMLKRCRRISITMCHNTCVFQCMQNYCLFRNYCWRHFFCLRTDFACFSCCKCLPVLKRRKNPTKRRKNQTKRRTKIKSPKCGNWNGEKNWKQRKFRQPAIIIAVSDFER